MTPEEVSAREERVPSLAERIASAMALGMPEVMPTVADVAVQPSDERIVEVTQRVIEEAVQAGPAVLVGRGAQCMLAERAATRCTSSATRRPRRWSSYAVTNLGVAPRGRGARRGRRTTASASST